MVVLSTNCILGTVDAARPSESWPSRSVDGGSRMTDNECWRGHWGDSRTCINWGSDVQSVQVAGTHREVVEIARCTSLVD